MIDDPLCFFAVKLLRIQDVDKVIHSLSHVFHVSSQVAVKQTDHVTIEREPDRDATFVTLKCKLGQKSHNNINLDQWPKKSPSYFWWTMNINFHFCGLLHKRDSCYSSCYLKQRCIRFRNSTSGWVMFNVYWCESHPVSRDASTCVRGLDVSDEWHMVQFGKEEKQQTLHSDGWQLKHTHTRIYKDILRL